MILPLVELLRLIVHLSFPKITSDVMVVQPGQDWDRIMAPERWTARPAGATLPDAWRRTRIWAKRKAPASLRDGGLRWIPEALEVSGLSHDQ